MKYSKEEIEKIISDNRYFQYGSRDDESAWYRDNTPAKLLLTKIVESQCGFGTDLPELCLFLVEYTTEIDRFSFVPVPNFEYFMVYLDNKFLFSFIQNRDTDKWKVWDFIDFETAFKITEKVFQDSYEALEFYQENIHDYFNIELDYENKKVSWCEKIKV